jgi:DNA-binding MarR family transcriptional regulator
VLRARDGLSNAQLARRSLITPQSMSQVLASLVDRAYVRRRADPAHGRVIRTELTTAGRAVLAACDDAVGEIEREMLSGLGPEDRERLLASVTSCVRTLGAGLADS